MRPLAKKSLLCTIVVYISCLFCAVQGNYKDYCNPSLCNGTKHIACLMHPDQLAPACQIDADVIDMTDDLQTYTLDTLNDVRNQMANKGNANKMCTLVWDTELAYIAEMNVRQCLLNRQHCQNTERFKNVGQTLYVRNIKGQVAKIKDVIYYIVLDWLNEIRYDGYESLVYHKYWNDEFSQLLNGNSQRVGCAALQQSSSGWIQTYFACNYDVAPIERKPLFEYAVFPGEDCKDNSMNPKFTGLCSAIQSDSPGTNSTTVNSTNDEDGRAMIDDDDAGTKKQKRIMSILGEKTPEEREKLRFQRFLHKMEEAKKLENLYRTRITSLNNYVNVDGIPQKINGESRGFGMSFLF